MSQSDNHIEGRGMSDLYADESPPLLGTILLIYGMILLGLMAAGAVHVIFEKSLHIMVDVLLGVGACTAAVIALFCLMGFIYNSVHP